MAPFQKSRCRRWVILLYIVMYLCAVPTMVLNGARMTLFRCCTCPRAEFKYLVRNNAVTCAAAHPHHPPPCFPDFEVVGVKLLLESVIAHPPATRHVLGGVAAKDFLSVTCCLSWDNMCSVVFRRRCKYSISLLYNTAMNRWHLIAGHDTTP